MLLTAFLLSLTNIINTMRNLYILSFLVLLIFNPISILAQSDTVFNQTDAKNLKQGYWKKSYPNGKLMYKGFFKDNKPVGEMRRYFESGALKALLNYNSKGEYARARLFYENGQVAAEGNYFNSTKDSTWVYYSFYDRTVTSRESYLRGARHGMMINYYNNGDVSEKIEWKNNQKSGIWEQYFKGNILRLKAFYINNKLEGDFVVYAENNKPYLHGNYKNDLREGKWTFYKVDGTVETELEYKQGKSADEDKLVKEQQEFFKLIDENQGKFEEPDENNFLSPSGK
jgi:antitoxin component YwqK of YwqJK toxin-antitoxin module